MNKSQTWIQRFSGKITYLRLLIRVSTRTRSRANDEVGTRTWGWLATSRRSLIFYAKFNPTKRAHRLSIISPLFWCFLSSLFFTSLPPRDEFKGLTKSWPNEFVQSHFSDGYVCTSFSVGLALCAPSSNATRWGKIKGDLTNNTHLIHFPLSGPSQLMYLSKNLTIGHQIT